MPLAGKGSSLLRVLILWQRGALRALHYSSPRKGQGNVGNAVEGTAPQSCLCYGLQGWGSDGGVMETWEKK